MELFVPQKRESAVDTVLNNIKRLLISNKLTAGDRLPNELEISKGLLVSRGSVREAMKILSAFGIIEIKPGDGTYISTTAGNNIFNPLMFSFILCKPNIEELTEFRDLIELNVIELIIKNCDNNAEEIKALINSFEQFTEKREGNATPSELAQFDIEFHQIMAKATKNKLVEKIYLFILEFLEPSIIKTHEHQLNGIFAINTHKQIIDAILSKDLNIAKNAIEEAVRVWKDLQLDSN